MGGQVFAACVGPALACPAARRRRAGLVLCAARAGARLFFEPEQRSGFFLGGLCAWQGFEVGDYEEIQFNCCYFDYLSVVIGHRALIVIGYYLLS